MLSFCMAQGGTLSPFAGQMTVGFSRQLQATGDRTWHVLISAIGRECNELAGDPLRIMLMLENRGEKLPTTGGSVEQYKEPHPWLTISLDSAFAIKFAKQILELSTPSDELSPGLWMEQMRG